MTTTWKWVFTLGALGLLGAVLLITFQQKKPIKQEPPEKKIELNPEKQKAIWDAEHITFEIEHRFGKAFRQALKDRDEKGLEQFFLDDFIAEMPEESSSQIRKHGPLTEINSVYLKTINELDRSAFTKHLLTIVEPFQTVSRSKLRVLEIAKDNSESNLWSTTLLLSLVGTDKDGQPLLHQSKHKVTHLVNDAEALARAPSVLAWQVSSQSVRHSEQTFMKEVTSEVGLDKLPIPDNWKLPPTKTFQYRFQVAVDDFNRDGYPDLALAVHKERPYLLQSRRGKLFKDVTLEKGIKAFNSRRDMVDLLAAWIDYDNDGYPDLLIGNRLYHNEQGKSFKDVTAISRIRIEPECLGACVADYDCDGLLDLYLVYQQTHGTNPESTPEKKSWVEEGDSGKENQLWRNEGNGTFRNVTMKANAGGGKRHTHAATWFFYNDDHYPDLYLANDFGRNVLLQNNGDGTFKDVSAQSGAAGYATSMGVTTGDVNNDGLSDIYVANMFSKMGRRIIGQVSAEDYPVGIYEQIKGSCAGNRLYLRSSLKSEFQDKSVQQGVNEVGWAYAPAMIDLDGDGWLDLYATTGFMSFTHDEPDG